MAKGGTEKANGKPDKTLEAPKKWKGPNRTVQECYDAMMEALRKKENEGESVPTLRYIEFRMKPVLEILGDRHESDINSDLRHAYCGQRRATSPRTLAEATIEGEWQGLLTLLRFETNSQGDTIGTVAKKVKFSKSNLEVLRTEGLFTPSVEARVEVARGKGTPRYTEQDRRALETYVTLRRAGISKRAILETGATILEYRPDLGRPDGSLNKVFSELPLEARQGDICQPTGKGTFLSWRYAPNQKFQDDDEMTVAGFAEQFYLPSIDHRYSKATVVGIAQRFREHIYRTFAHRRLDEVGGLIQEFAKKSLAEGYAPVVLQQWRACLRDLLAMAKEEGLYQGDPVADTVIKNVHQIARGHYPTFPLHLIEAFCGALETPWDIWFLLRALVGLPTREVNALRPQDVRLDDGPIPTIRIEVEWAQKHRKVLSAPEKSQREQPIPQVIADRLRPWLADLKRRGIGYVFPNQDGRPMSASSVYPGRGRLRHAAKAVGIPGRAIYRLNSLAETLIYEELARRPELRADLAEHVLRVPRPKNPRIANPREIQQMFDVLNKVVERALGTETETAPLRRAAPAKHRGRPTKLSFRRKQKALEARHRGAMWREVAAILYDTSEPTGKQIKSAPTNIKNFEKRHGSNTLMDDAT